MEKLEAIELINTLVVVDHEGDGEILLYAHVRDDKDTRNVLNKLKADEWLDNPKWSYADYFRSEEDDKLIDIAPLAFRYAEYFDGDMFIEFAP